jgi:hypothetical protein
MHPQLKMPQLLEAIGAISKSDAQKATSQKGNYQDSTTTPLSRLHDNEAVVQNDGDQLDDVNTHSRRCYDFNNQDRLQQSGFKSYSRVGV